MIASKWMFVEVYALVNKTLARFEDDDGEVPVQQVRSTDPVQFTDKMAMEWSTHSAHPAFSEGPPNKVASN